MRKQEYKAIEDYMLDLMKDSAHDKHHIYRVLFLALDIARYEKKTDMDVLVAACLLHDIGREQQAEDLDLDHAKIGAKLAFDFLLARQWSSDKAQHVRDCIASHRYRKDSLPESLEAKILFDADKLDAAGAMGIARTLIYGGQIYEPLYILDEEDEIVTEGGGAEVSSFFQEYNYKLKNIYDTFFTDRAKEIAASRQKTALVFYEGLYMEISHNYREGKKLLSEWYNFSDE